MRQEHDVDYNTSVNLCFGDGRSLVALRFTFDYNKSLIEDKLAVRVAVLEDAACAAGASIRTDLRGG